MNTVAFAPDGKKLFAGGGDNRIRVWAISENGLETTIPILESRFAHDGAVLSLVFSPDGKWLLSSASDQTLKVWDAEKLTEHQAFERQPDWAPALVFSKTTPRWSLAGWTEAFRSTILPVARWFVRPSQN